MENDKEIHINRFPTGSSIGGGNKDDVASSLNPLKGSCITSEQTNVTIIKKSNPTSQFSQKDYNQKVLDYELNRVPSK